MSDLEAGDRGLIRDAVRGTLDALGFGGEGGDVDVDEESGELTARHHARGTATGSASSGGADAVDDLDDETKALLLETIDAVSEYVETLRGELEAEFNDRAETVDELIEKGDTFDESRRAELMASSPKLLEDELGSLQEAEPGDDEPQASQLPATGVLASIGAPSPAGDADEDDGPALGLADHTPDALEDAAPDAELAGIPTGTAELTAEQRREVDLAAGKRFECDDCGARFGGRNQLRQHRETDHYE